MHIYSTMPKLSVNTRWLCMIFRNYLREKKEWNSSHNYLLFLHLWKLYSYVDISFTKSTFLRCLLCAINDTCSSYLLKRSNISLYYQNWSFFFYMETKYFLINKAEACNTKDHLFNKFQQLFCRFKNIKTWCTVRMRHAWILYH